MLLLFPCDPQSPLTPSNIRYEIITKFDEEQKSAGYEFGSRAVYAPKKFRGYSLGYYGYHQETQEQARERFVKAVESLLSALNTEPRLKDTFEQYPLTHLNLNIFYVNFVDEGIVAKKPFVSVVSTKRDVIEYRLSTTEDKDDDEIIREPYLEAYEKVYGHPKQ
jgi:hypothetical protein